MLGTLTLLLAGCGAMPGNVDPAPTPAAAPVAAETATPPQTPPVAQHSAPAASSGSSAPKAVAPQAPANEAAEKAAPAKPEIAAVKTARPAPAETKQADSKAAGPKPDARKATAAPRAPSEAAPAAASPAVTAEAPRKEVPAAAVRPASLDIGTLEKRLRDTKAIGVMSKLALKNQIDDLLARFRKAHDSGGNVAPLRQPYESLVGKVQSLLDGDPKLAAELSASREAIWGVLVDPAKFRSLS